MSNDEGLKFTGKLFGGFIADIRRKVPFYGSDFKDGLSGKVVGTTLFMFFAAVANAIAFGALTALYTGNQIGIMEMLVITAAGGVVFALLAGQPLTILGGTGPIVIFTGLLFEACRQLEISFLATYAWVGIWSGVLLLICAFVDASALMRYFTRFTDEIFAALISVIFIVEAVKNVVEAFQSDTGTHAAAFLTLILALGTFVLARNLKAATNSPYLRRRWRDFLSDFGPAIAIIAMTLFASQFPDVQVAAPVVPDNVQTTSGRSWQVDLFAVPTWVIFAAIGPALLATILLFLDQNITVRLVNSPDYKLRKGSGYHLDLAIVGLIVLGASFFALPWIVAATVHSLNHVKALATVKVVDTNGTKREEFVGVLENRVSPLLVHVLIGVSIFFLSYASYVPMAVLFGLFLFMGLNSLGGNQFFERLMLWIRDPKLYPDVHYTQLVPRDVLHKFTAIQLLSLVALWILKSSSLGILFPLLIAALVPIQFLVVRMFGKKHVDILVDEGEHEEEGERTHQFD